MRLIVFSTETACMRGISLANDYYDHSAMTFKRIGSRAIQIEWTPAYYKGLNQQEAERVLAHHIAHFAELRSPDSEREELRIRNLTDVQSAGERARLLFARQRRSRR